MRVQVLVSSSDCYTHPGSPMALVQTAKLCELRSLLFTPRDNNVSVLSLSVFSLFPSLPFIRSLDALSLFHHSLPCCTSSPGWPSVTFTPCPGWLSLYGWLWCPEHQRRTSYAVNSWGSSPCWWSKPPRTSWVFICTHTWLSSVTEFLKMSHQFKRLYSRLGSREPYENAFSNICLSYYKMAFSSCMDTANWPIVETTSFHLWDEKW